MRKTFKFFMCAAIVAAGFTGCSSEDVDVPKGGNGDEQESYSKIIIKDAAPKSYAESAEIAADANEGITDTKALKLFVYKSDGNYDSNTPTVIFTQNGNDFESNTIKMNSGLQYIYIFNDPKDLITTPPPTIKNAFELQEVLAGLAETAETYTVDNTATYKYVNGVPSNIAESNKFLIGVLWGQLTDVPAGGTQGSPASFTIEIGRSAAKVRLESVAKGATSPLKGTFDVANAKYRLASVPTKSYLVGQWENTSATNPGAVPGVGVYGQKVISAVHNEAWGTGTPGTDAVPNPLFKVYDWSGALTPGASTHYYAVENTTAPDAITKDLYYGNTTYMQLEIKYTPDAATELRDPVNHALNANANVNGDFWTAICNGKDLMFFTDSPADSPTNKFTGITKYTEGKTTYSFAIKDALEPADLQLRILRNHFYNLKITKIAGLGANDNLPKKPYIPIPTETEVTVNVTVLGWAPVNQDIELP